VAHPCISIYLLGWDPYVSNYFPTENSIGKTAILEAERAALKCLLHNAEVLQAQTKKKIVL
jgi:hypothetical protein